MDRVNACIDAATISQKLSLVLQGVMDAGNSDAYENGVHFMNDWDWFQGVALLALYRVSQSRGGERILAYIKKWFARQKAKGLPAPNINSVCPLLTLSFLYEREPELDELLLLKEWANAIMTSFPRTEHGGLQHITRDAANEQQIWADTLYMTVLFLGRMGTLLKNDAWVAESVAQMLLHIKYLQDTTTGLLYHGYDFREKSHLGNAFWARGNAWYTAGIVDYLEMTSVPAHVQKQLISALQKQVSALCPLQTKDGMWHTLLDERETSYAEASATAGIAYGILKAVRKGWLPPSCSAYGLDGAKAVLRHIDEQGLLQQVSAGTCFERDKESYRRIRIQPQPYGQAMALLLLDELLYQES